MLFILLPTAWLAVLALLVCVCRMAAKADGSRVSSGTLAGPIGERIVLSSMPIAPPAQTRRPRGQRAPLHSARPAPSRRRVAAHVGR